MSRRKPGQVQLTVEARRVVAHAIMDLEEALRFEIIGLIGQEGGSVHIVPAPGAAKELMRMLGETDWKSMRRTAEEFET